MFSFFIFFFASIECDCPHTKVYTEYGPSNQDNFYFIEETYNRGDFTCKIGINQQYKQTIINSGLHCEGLWCNFTGNWIYGWNCPLSESSCYEVEHIIPNANNIPEIQGCSTDIFGNRVMAYKQWNRQLSNGYFSEKKEMYKNIFNQAYYAIYNCCNKTGTPVLPTFSCEEHSNYLFWTGICILAALTFCIILLIYKDRHKNNENDIETVNMKINEDLNEDTDNEVNLDEIH